MALRMKRENAVEVMSEIDGGLGSDLGQLRLRSLARAERSSKTICVVVLCILRLDYDVNDVYTRQFSTRDLEDRCQ